MLPSSAAADKRPFPNVAFRDVKQDTRRSRFSTLWFCLHAGTCPYVGVASEGSLFDCRVSTRLQAAILAAHQKSFEEIEQSVASGIDDSRTARKVDVSILAGRRRARFECVVGTVFLDETGVYAQ